MFLGVNGIDPAFSVLNHDAVLQRTIVFGELVDVPFLELNLVAHKSEKIAVFLDRNSQLNEIGF